MDIKLLKSFLTVARLENITQAAEELNFSQPSITFQIQTLEETLGVLLFERVGKKLHITEAGREFIIHAEQIIDYWEQTINELSYYKNKYTNLRIGVSTHIINDLLPHVIHTYQNCVPNGSISIQFYMNTKETINALLNNKFNVGLIHDEVKSERLLQYKIMSDELIWVGSKELISSNNNIQNIWAYPFIGFAPGTVFRDKFDTLLKKANIRSSIEYSDALALKQAILGGLGISFLPKTLINQNLLNGTLVQLFEAPKLELDIYVVFKNSVFSTSTYRLLNIVSDIPGASPDLKNFLCSYKERGSFHLADVRATD